MELFNFLGLTAFGPFLGGLLANILANRSDTGLQQIETALRTKLRDGRLPENHALQAAVRDALRQALRSLVLSLADSHHPASPFLKQLRAQLFDPNQRQQPVTTLLNVKLWTTQDSAERDWINQLARCIEDPATLEHLVKQGLVEGVDGLLGENPGIQTGERLSRAVSAWIDAELHDTPGRPVMLADWLQNGWPLGDQRHIDLYQAWCWFFRAAIQQQPQVFNLYVAATLAELKHQFGAASTITPQAADARLEDFSDFLSAQSADLKDWLDSHFQHIKHTQTEHTDLLHRIRADIGGFPKLWRDSRRWRYGSVGVVLLIVSGLGVIIQQNRQAPAAVAQAVQHSFDAKIVAARLRSDITQRFEQDQAQAVQAGQHYDAILKLEQQRDAALAKVDDVVATIEQGLASTPDPVFVEASRLLQQDGADAALKYLDAHRADRQARHARDQASAAAAEEKLRQDAQTLFLEAELRQTRFEWDAALKALQEAADLAPHWWQTHYRVGAMLRKITHYAEAKQHLQVALALAEREKDKANAMNELAIVYYHQSAWIEAELLFKEVVKLYKKNYGQTHPYVATALNNFALLLKATDRPVDAEQLMWRALAIDKKYYGSEHPNVAVRLNNLATLMYATKRLEKAESLMRKVVDIFEKNYGPEHPNVATALNNFARLLQATKRLEDAEPRQRQAVLILLKLSHTAGHALLGLERFYGNYQTLLDAQKLKPAVIAQRLESLSSEAGYSPAQWTAMRAEWKQP